MLTASVIVPARDAQRTLERALTALGGQQLAGGFEVIVVDNGSRDATAAIAAASGTVTRVIRRARGEGPGAARNAGAAAASGAVLAFLDADCWPTAEWLAGGVSACAGSDLVQGRVLPDPEAELGPFDRTLSIGAASGLFESANLFVRRDLHRQIGGFGAGLEALSGGRLGAPFGEDVVFGWRARRAGARTAFSEQALAYHAVQARSPSGYVAERLRLSLFPQLVAEVPELRREFFYQRYFHSQRSASFDLAVAGLALALARRRATPLLAALPYARVATAGARTWGRGRAPQVALTEVLADAVGAGSLLLGSARAGALLL